jgi:archaellum biogenesis protein FlaJ (TadC family)
VCVQKFQFKELNFTVSKTQTESLVSSKMYSAHSYGDKYYMLNISVCFPQCSYIIF